MIPGSANPLLLKSAAAAGGYQIERSLRFNSSDSAYLSRTPAVAGNRRTWTLSWWLKRSGLTTFQSLFNSFTDGTNRTAINFDSSVGSGGSGDYLTMFNVSGGATTSIFQTNALFRDVSALYHIVVSVDTTQATSTDRVKLWVNNTLQTFSAYNAPSQNADLDWNSATTHYFGVYGGSPGTTSYGFNGYLADIHFIDGQALTPSSFTEVSATTGQLIPKAYTGSFNVGAGAVNGFWLKFSDNSAATATTLGKDYSGNSNNWTPNNLSVTAGAGNDSLVDTPTSAGTDTGVGGVVTGNYATLNPLDNGGVTLSDGNLSYRMNGNGYKTVRSTFGVSSGKWYWEQTIVGSPNAGIHIGVVAGGTSLAGLPGGSGTGGYGYSYSGEYYYLNGSYISGTTTYTTGDVVACALDVDNRQIRFYRNNTLISQGVINIDSSLQPPFFAACSSYLSGTGSDVNFGQRPFAYAAPSGFKALCDTNLPAPVVAKPNTVMDVITRAGGGTTQTFATLRPGLVWEKRRDSSSNHYLFDVNRGNDNYLSSNLTSAEAASAGAFTFNTNSYTVSSGFDWPGGATVVDWVWDAGTSTVSNTAGSITSQVRANASAGFSVVTYTATGSTLTVGHGLGVAPELIIIKGRTSTASWAVYTKAVGTSAFLLLNTTAAVQNFNVWNNTSPTSTVFTVGAPFDEGNTAGVNHVAYCFAPVAGYSSALAWTGNGSADGPLLHCGFLPRFFIAKRTDSANDWWMWDTARSNTGNPVDEWLSPNRSDAEYPNDADFDFLSNGIKIRTSSSTVNASAGSYIGYAWASNPFQYARAQ